MHNVVMNSGYRSIATSGIALLLLFGLDAGVAQVTGWRPFASRSGWYIRYPTSWTTGSCNSCPDTRAPRVYVDFLPPEASTNDGSVMVSPLADRPFDISLDAWFAQVETSANLNPEKSRLRFMLNGMPALKVRYLNAARGTEMEEVYVVSGSRTFSIGFSSDRRGPLENLPNFVIYKTMIESFKSKGH
jgi:hypothetical protein